MEKKTLAWSFLGFSTSSFIPTETEEENVMSKFQNSHLTHTDQCLLDRCVKLSTDRSFYQKIWKATSCRGRRSSCLGPDDVLEDQVTKSKVEWHDQTTDVDEGRLRGRDFTALAVATWVLRYEK
mmetsp:Transcript_3890/g.7852  ORF Transcript_3890/g.7852 Transcript_3890/m.7852 type:complete len:124 (+) Transcript_3890:601-972(+)